MRTLKTLLLTLTLLVQLPVLAATSATLYKNPNCGCCDAYADYLKRNGFDVKIVNTPDRSAIKKKYSVPETLEGCHTMLIGSYVFEGLIPAEYIQRVLKEHRPIKGLSLPGMPVGAPGMPGAKTRPLYVYNLEASSNPKVFASF